MNKIAATLGLAGLVSAAAAQTAAPGQTNAPAGRPFSLQDCIREALQHNFDVRVERYEPLKAQLGVDLAQAGYDPSLSLSGTHSHDDYSGPLQIVNGTFTQGRIVTENNSFSTGLGGALPSGATYNIFGNVGDTYEPYPENASGQVGVNVTQPLLKNLWIDGTRLAVTAAKNQVKYTAQGLRQQLITTVTAVENAYFEVIYARENVTVEQQALDLAQTQLEQDRQRVLLGSIAERAGTIEQDEAQVASSRASLILAASTLGTDQRQLKNLITDDYSAWVNVDIEPTMALDAPRQLFDLQDSWNKGMSLRPELLQARLSLEQQGIQLKYDRNQLFPELDLVGSLGYNGAGSGYSQTFDQYQAGDRPFYSYGAQVTMPLSNLKARSNYRTDKAAEAQDLLKLKQLEQLIIVQIDNAVGVARSDYESVDASREQRVYAEAALDAEQKKYAVGKSTTFTVLQLQNNVTGARSAEIRALANYQEALTALAQQEGSTLERRDVDVTAK